MLKITFANSSRIPIEAYLVNVFAITAISLPLH